MLHPLDEIIHAQKRGEPRGIASICSAHPWVLRAAMRVNGTLLIESTCNQVNQFGGYTGMTPQAFVAYVHDLAVEQNFPASQLILGGDHLGPHVWQKEPASAAMEKAQMLVQSCVRAGYTKIHLDASMKLGDDDPIHPLEIDLIAQRTAQLVKVAEETSTDTGQANQLRYVIGSEVPIPGGVTTAEPGIHVTHVEDIRQMLEATHSAMIYAGIEAAWERVIALVVQPGVEFGDDFVIDYRAEAAQDLVRFVETTPFVYEAHSTDYQTRDKLRNLVRDHFAILKVGPALTFVFRQAVFALARMENELLPLPQRSCLIEKLDDAMQREPGYWLNHYHGSAQEVAFARKYSLSDRSRYYWAQPDVQSALNVLLANLRSTPLPLSLVSQYFPQHYPAVREGRLSNAVESLLIESIRAVLRDYHQACTPVPISE
ncbi:MAG: class II D-tagatose-bisphosphate aldolase, non-catalytic subunit [Anaerolineales bacterium]